MKRVLAFFAGFLFAVGLGVSGMTQPARVRGFLDVLGAWDPSLVFVMAGAVTVYFLANRLRPTVPRFAPSYKEPLATAIDARLLGGALLFGVGWGISGFCPGPALVSLTSGTSSVFVFVGAMLAGMLLYRQLGLGRT